MKKNMGWMDRILRILIAATVLLLHRSGVITGTLFTVLLILSSVFVVTSIVGYCPLYSVFGKSTQNKKG
jgi:hypothetical protein